jgi:beta-glucanase (GH16 family)
MMSFSSTLLTFGLLLTALSPATAQTFSECDPTQANVTSCPDDPALGSNFNFNFAQPNISDTWNYTNGMAKYTSNGAEFTINKRFDSPTVRSKFYIFFGHVEVIFKAAAGQGVVSSIVLQSDNRDEVDWEWIGGNNTHVQSNYFGKGNDSTFDRAVWHPVDKPIDNFHNYTVVWTSDMIQWYIDSALIRTLPYKDANGGHNFPQTPMTVRLGIWAGGDPSNNNGTIEWAGGLTDFSQAPYTMTVKSVAVTDFSTGVKAYQFGDKSGSWQSIKKIA